MTRQVTCRRGAAAAAVLALAVPLLAACGEDEPTAGGTAAADPPTASAPPSTPSATPEPTRAPPLDPTREPTPAPTPAPDPAPAPSAGPPRVLGTVAAGLEAPWGLDFLPDGDAIVTERDSERVLRVTPDGEVTVLGTVDDAAPEGEGGLLGVALSPTFDDDRLVYLYLTTATDNRVVRAPLRGDRLGATEVLLDGIPRGFTHDGGRLEFGPDGLLYVSTGESGEPSLAQDRGSLGGKILRLTPDGEPAPGNPFGSPVWSEGHRNVQGLAFDDDGRLWASEFGQDAFDELNLIEAGGNYGWPEVEGTGGEPDYVDPRETWSTDENSPSGLAWADGRLWLAALRGERLWRVDVEGGRTTGRRGFLLGDYGRLRTVALAPDGSLWVMTSNRDGRGEPTADDDRILRVRP